MTQIQTSKHIKIIFYRSRLSRNKVAFFKPGRNLDIPKSQKNKNFFITDNYNEGPFYKPVIPNPALRPYIERSKIVPKEQRLKESKLVSQYKDHVIRSPTNNLSSDF